MNQVRHNVVFELVWQTCRQREVFTSEKSQARAHKFMDEVCRKKGWRLLESSVRPDTIAVTVRVDVNTSARKAFAVLKKSVIAAFPKEKKIGPSFFTTEFDATSDYYTDDLT
jgi:REP element-mobilizing transposase RayT